MRVLLLGGGRQGRAVLYDLARSAEVERVTCADANPAGAEAFAARNGCTKAMFQTLYVSDAAGLAALVAEHDAVVDMLPRQFIPAVGRAAITARKPLVNTYYNHDLLPLAGEAAAAGVALLPEMGFDPGIDLVLYGEVIRRFDTVRALSSYGGGFPEPSAADNPLQYKISWTWEGVLNSYDRAARQVVRGQVEEIAAASMFDLSHEIFVEGVGELEAFVNGDMVRYLEQLGIRETVTDAARYTLRWPGHCRLWQALVQLGFLEQTPVDGLGVSPRQLLERHLEPRLQYAEQERDLIVLRVQAVGEWVGETKRVVIDVVDRRDLDSGLMAMNRAVGFPASIAAQMLVRGEITGCGLLAPALDVPYARFMEALVARGIEAREREDAVTPQPTRA